jgi:cytochrome c biogenesis protein CcmG/thiol:disulfide interchange protein DsbE
MKKIAALFFVAVLYAIIAFAQNNLPSTVIKNLNGENVAFNTIPKKGRVTVVSFWATWCVPCKKEINNMAEVMPEWKKSMDFDLVTVSIDDTRNVAKVKSYVNAQRWDFTTYIDANQDLKRALAFQSIPYTIIIDQTGTIVHTHAGYVEGDEFVLRDKLKEVLAK